MELKTALDLRNLQKPKMLIEEILPAESITLIVGPTYSGKTFLAMEMARAVAFGYKALGKFPVYNQGNVVFIEQDSPIWDTGKAFYAMIRKDMDALLAGPGGGHPLEALQFAWHQGLNLQNKSHVGEIAVAAGLLYTELGFYSHPDEGIKEGFLEGCRLIVMDTFRALHGAEENSSTEMESIMRTVKWLRDETGAAIILIHHGPKPKPGDSNYIGSRGSTAIEAAVDIIYKVTAPKDVIYKQVTAKKARAIQPPDFRYVISTDGDNKSVKLWEGKAVTPSKMPERLLMLQERIAQEPIGGVDRKSLEEWREVNKIGKNALYRLLQQLKADGSIRHVMKSTGAGVDSVYFPVDKPEKEA